MKLSEYKMIATQMSQKLAAAAALVVLLVGLSIQPAISALTNHSTEIDSNHHFPVWFQDSKGLSLEMCLDPGMCTPDPVIPGNVFSGNTGFGDEAFFWSAEANLILPGNRRALLVLALEAAYGAGAPAPNDQLLFGRVRMRIDAPVTGTYKVWHPYLGAGCEPEVFNVTAGRRAINVTRDIGGGAPFDTALTSEVGPFLVWDPDILPLAPDGFVGNPAVEHEVANGRCGINYFKIQGPAGADLDGQGLNVVQTNLFSVQGKIFDGAVPPSLQPIRATYSRRTSAGATRVTSSRINTFVNAPANATVTLLNPQTGAEVPMTFDGVDTFFRGIRLNEATSSPMPDFVKVTATNPGGSASLNIEVTDLVRITTATWTESTGTLRVVAVSSDKIAVGEGDPQPVLTLKFGARNILMEQKGAAGRYEVVVPATVPPARVTVESSKGDSAIRRVLVR